MNEYDFINETYKSYDFAPQKLDLQCLEKTCHPFYKTQLGCTEYIDDCYTTAVNANKKWHEIRGTAKFCFSV